MAFIARKSANGKDARVDGPWRIHQHEVFVTCPASLLTPSAFLIRCTPELGECSLEFSDVAERAQLHC